jgi:hypothetical protein
MLARECGALRRGKTGELALVFGSAVNSQTQRLYSAAGAKHKRINALRNSV